MSPFLCLKSDFPEISEDIVIQSLQRVTMAVTDVLSNMSEEF